MWIWYVHIIHCVCLWKYMSTYMQMFKYTSHLIMKSIQIIAFFFCVDASFCCCCKKNNRANHRAKNIGSVRLLETQVFFMAYALIFKPNV